MLQYIGNYIKTKFYAGVVGRGYSDKFHDFRSLLVSKKGQLKRRKRLTQGPITRDLFFSHLQLLFSSAAP